MALTTNPAVEIKDLTKKYESKVVVDNVYQFFFSKNNQS